MSVMVSSCLRVNVPLQQQFAELLGVCNRQGAGEVLADVGCGHSVLLGHGGQSGKTLGQEGVRDTVGEHQDLRKEER